LLFEDKTRYWEYGILILKQMEELAAFCVWFTYSGVLFYTGCHSNCETEVDAGRDSDKRRILYQLGVKNRSPLEKSKKLSETKKTSW